MINTKIFKGFALINFVGLLTLFLFFRNGSFDNFFYNNTEKKLTSPNGGTPTKIISDSVTQRKIDLQVQRLSSSKSVVIIDNFKLKKETSKTIKDTNKLDIPEEEKRLMYSSKSGIIMDPKQRIILDPKLLKIDSVNFNKPKKKINR